MILVFLPQVAGEISTCNYSYSGCGCCL